MHQWETLFSWESTKGIIEHYVETWYRESSSFVPEEQKGRQNPLASLPSTCLIPIPSWHRTCPVGQQREWQRSQGSSAFEPLPWVQAVSAAEGTNVKPVTKGINSSGNQKKPRSSATSHPGQVSSLVSRTEMPSKREATTDLPLSCTPTATYSSIYASHQFKFPHLHKEISPSPNTSPTIQSPCHHVSHLSHLKWAGSCPPSYTHLQGELSRHKERYEKAFKHSFRMLRLTWNISMFFPLDNLQTLYVHQGPAQPQRQWMLGTTSCPNKGIGTKNWLHKWHLKLNPWVVFVCCHLNTTGRICPK